MYVHATFESLTTKNIVIYNSDKDVVSPALNQEVVEYELCIAKEKLRNIAAFLKLHSIIRATNAIDLTVIDLVNQRQRFNVTYQLQSLTTNSR